MPGVPRPLVAIAAEKAYGIKISNNARIIRNLLEGAQFLHSHILWFYNLAALDYVNPLNALKADPADAYDLAQAAGTSMNSDFVALKERLANFADNGQLSIFSGNWFDAEDGTAYQLPPELDLICTAHYLEALTMQAKASQISAIIGGKMPHVMTLVPGGTAFVPTDQKLDELKALADEIYDWSSRHDPRHPCYRAVLHRCVELGKGLRPLCGLGRVRGPGRLRQLHRADGEPLPAMGVIDDKLNLSDVQENLITEYMGRSWYKGDATYTSPYFVTEPEYTEYNVEDRYTWVKCPAYDGKPYEAGGLSRVLAAYKRNVPFVVEQVDGLLEALGAPGRSESRSRRSAAPPFARSRRSTSPAHEGLGCRAHRGAEERRQRVLPRAVHHHRRRHGLLGGSARRALPLREHQGRQDRGLSDHHPTTWNLAPINESGDARPDGAGAYRQPGGDIEKPINALRTVHSFDPARPARCTSPSRRRARASRPSRAWGVK